MWSGKKFIKYKQKNFRLFLKKKKKTEKDGKIFFCKKLKKA